MQNETMYNASGIEEFNDGRKQPSISRSDYIISSGQLQPRYVVRKISGMLSDLHELGEANKSDGDFSETTRKYRCNDRRFSSDDCRYALCIRTLDRKVPNTEVPYSRTSHLSDIGALCETCTGHPIINGTCLKIADQRTVFGSSTLHSFTVTDCSTFSPSETVIEKFCRICHSFGSSGDPLISPCRCTGSLKYVHISCLLHWLTICAHKLKRPAICELCLYKYRRRNMIDWHNLHLPSISRHDLRYLIAFIIAATMMFLSAAASFICFCIERNLVRNDTMDDSFEMIGKESGEWETLLTSSTFLSAFLFFVALFVALYAHVKTNTSLASYIYRFWVNNQNWMIEEYRPSRDQRYCHKMEQLRRRLNDEVTPNYGTGVGAPGEMVYSRDGVRQKAVRSAIPSSSRVVAFLRSSSLLSSPSAPTSISGFDSAIPQQRISIDNVTTTTPPNTIPSTNYISSVATPAVV